MAKQLVNPIERHVEKAVLGVAGLALLAVIALYAVTTPNSLELGGERVTPRTIDQKVAQKALDVAARLKAAPPKSSIPEPLHNDFAVAIKPLEHGPLPAAVALGPDVPIVDRPGPIGGQAALVKVQTPPKPVLSHGRSTLITLVGDQTRYVPSDWVSVAAMFDVRTHREAQKREYGPKGEDVIFGPPHVQRRQRRPDGGWSEGDWQDVNPWPAFKLPPEPGIVLIDEGGKLTVDKDMLKQIENFYNDIANPKVQLDIIRPMPPDMAPPTHWAMPAITAYRDVLKQDDEYLNPNEAPAPDPVDRYGLSGDSPRKEVKKELTPEQQRANDLQETQRLIELAKQTRSKDHARRAYNLGVGVFTDRQASASDKDRAKKLMDAAEQVERDITREELIGGGKVGRPDGDEVAAKKRDKLPGQQIWAHDAAVDSLENGAVYQYRMRFRVYNVLAGAPTKFSNPLDAAVLFLESDWSQPSDPVTIEPASLFFVTSEDAKDEQISVEFFRWYMGVWLKAGRIKAGIGETVYDKQRKEAPDLTDATKVDRPEIEFTADAMVVDIDFERPFRDRKQGTSAKGMRLADKPSPTTSVVFMDSQGRLSERFVSLDKIDPAKRAVPVWIPKAKP